jgi:hypothetical protein
VDRCVFSGTIFESYGDALYAVATDIATGAPDALLLASTLYALANAAEGSMMLVRAAEAAGGQNELVDVDAAGIEALVRAEAAIRQIRARVADVPLDDLSLQGQVTQPQPGQDH